MNLTQQKIYQYLQNHPSATAGEFSVALGMTTANIRHHLARMTQEGMIETSLQASSGRGRPTYRYSLSVRAQANNLDALANALLLELLVQFPQVDKPTAFQRLALRLLEILAAGGPLPPTAAHLTRRLTNGVQFLNSCHYQARWEAHASGPNLMLGHCPYAAILAQHPELCQVDAFLLERLLNSPVKQTARLGANAPACIFQVR
jgi:predicted ArsR family transcriptional regulator